MSIQPADHRFWILPFHSGMSTNTSFFQDSLLFWLKCDQKGYRDHEVNHSDVVLQRVGIKAQGHPEGHHFPGWAGSMVSLHRVYRTLEVTSWIMRCLHSWQESKCTSSSLSKNNLPDEFSLLFQSFFILPLNTPQKGLRLNLSISAST